jgi:integrase
MSTETRRPKSRPLEKTKHPGIFSRGNRFVVVYREPGGRQRKRSAHTIREALDFQKTVGADIIRGEYRELSRVTFKEYADEWCRTYRGRTRRGVADETLADYTDAIEKRAKPKLGRRRLAEITPQHLREFVAELEDAGLAPGSVRTIFAPVRVLFATALEDGLIRSNPASGVRIASRRDDAVDIAADLDEDTDRVKALSAIELRAVIGAVRCETHNRKPATKPCATCEAWRLFVRFLGETGLRIGEAVEIRHGDIESDGWLRVRRSFKRGKVGRPKGGKTRRVRLTSSMVDALDARRRAAWAGDGDLVFASSRGGRVDGNNFARRILKPAAKRAKVGEWPHPHTLRHTAATLLFRSGWNAVQVQKFLGHSDPGFTLRTYVHLLDEDLPPTEFLAAITTGQQGATDHAETGRTLTVATAS